MGMIVNHPLIPAMWCRDIDISWTNNKACSYSLSNQNVWQCHHHGTHYSHGMACLWSWHCTSVVTALFMCGHGTAHLWSRHCSYVVMELCVSFHNTAHLWSQHCTSVVMSLSLWSHLTVNL